MSFCCVRVKRRGYSAFSFNMLLCNETEKLYEFREMENGNGTDLVVGCVFMMVYNERTCFICRVYAAV